MLQIFIQTKIRNFRKFYILKVYFLKTRIHNDKAELNIGQNIFEWQIFSPNLFLVVFFCIFLLKIG